MRALVRHEYGPPDRLKIEDVPTPSPDGDEVLISVKAVSLNLGDWEILTGRPRYIAVLGTLFGPATGPGPAWPRGGVRTPKHKILGTDFAGTVEAVGADVSSLALGDDVFGMSSFGALAEYLVMKEGGAVAKMPPQMSYDQAAATPQPGFIALSALRGRDQVATGSTVLINGGGGGAGTTALQYALSLGAEVTAVDNGLKQEMMRSLGATHVVDYTRDDVTSSGRRFDLILDLAAHRSVFDHRGSLNPGGIYLMAGGGLRPSAEAGLMGPIVSRFSNKQWKFLLATDKKEDLDELAELFTAGTVVPVLDQRFTLATGADAFARVGDGAALGNVIISID